MIMPRHCHRSLETSIAVECIALPSRRDAVWAAQLADPGTVQLSATPYELAGDIISSDFISNCEASEAANSLFSYLNG